MSAVVNQVVLPGDEILLEVDPDDNQRRTVLGPGLRQQEDRVIAIKAGVLRKHEPSTYWIDCRQKKYVAVKGDNVIGIVTSTGGDVFRVDIGTSEYASLSYLAFEGATKRNRPNIKVGDLVFSKLLVASKGVEPELVCIDGKGRSSGLGVLPDGGFLVNIPSYMARRLLANNSSLLKSLGNPLPYEIAVGLNGRVWLKCRSVRETLDIANIVSRMEQYSSNELKVAVRKISNAPISV